ncbi:unnamed protein product [Amoebophrya sp. A25]|nr:unnamed protein product [Amoebophrya sp. A25]|eukprot:GSA25T00024187001.1
MRGGGRGSASSVVVVKREGNNKASTSAASVGAFPLLGMGERERTTTPLFKFTDNDDEDEVPDLQLSQLQIDTKDHADLNRSEDHGVHYGGGSSASATAAMGVQDQIEQPKHDLRSGSAVLAPTTTSEGLLQQHQPNDNHQPSSTLDGLHRPQRGGDHKFADLEDTDEREQDTDELQAGTSFSDMACFFRSGFFASRSTPAQQQSTASPEDHFPRQTDQGQIGGPTTRPSRASTTGSSSSAIPILGSFMPRLMCDFCVTRDRRDDDSTTPFPFCGDRPEIPEKRKSVGHEVVTTQRNELQRPGGGRAGYQGADQSAGQGQGRETGTCSGLTASTITTTYSHALTGSSADTKMGFNMSPRPPGVLRHQVQQGLETSTDDPPQEDQDPEFPTTSSKRPRRTTTSTKRQEQLQQLVVVDDFVVEPSISTSLAPNEQDQPEEEALSHETGDPEDEEDFEDLLEEESSGNEEESLSLHSGSVSRENFSDSENEQGRPSSIVNSESTLFSEDAETGF